MKGKVNRKKRTTNGLRIKRISKKKNKHLTLRSVIKAAKRLMISNRVSNKAVKSALLGARNIVSTAEGKIQTSRVLAIPKKIGGALPALLPIFAGLSAKGSSIGEGASVVKAIKDVNAAKQQLKENVRHNETMKAIALGKGLYLKPYKTGLGLYLNPSKN